MLEAHIGSHISTGRGRRMKHSTFHVHGQSRRFYVKWADAAARRLVLGVLSHLRHAELTIVEGEERLRLGRPDPQRPLRAVVHVHSPSFYRALLRGSVGLCDSYMDALWDCE